MATVRIYQSTDTGAGGLTTAAGSLITILDAVLINGFNSQTVTITSVSTTATVTSTNHGFTSLQRVLISGASPSAYNGEYAINVVDANTFTYTFAGGSSPATGTINAIVAPMGWILGFTGTNLRAYKTGTGSNQRFLQLDDTGTTTARFVGQETLSGVTGGTGAGCFPQGSQVSGGLYWSKSTSAVAAPWVIVGNENLMYMWVNSANTTTGQCIHTFGDFISYKAGDIYNTIAIGGTTSTPNTNNNFQLGVILNSASAGLAGHYVARNATGTAGAINVCKGAGWGNPGNQYFLALTQVPDPMNGSIDFEEKYILERYTTEARRGKLPGNWDGPGPISIYSTYGLLYGQSANMTGRVFMFFNTYNGGAEVLEISNTWDTT